MTEALFSMDGDLLDVARLALLKERFGFLSVVDEAHSFGALGPGGRGIARGVADIAVGTFGKAFGLFGAFLLLPELTKAYLINFSAPLMFTTTLPPSHAGAALEILDIVRQVGPGKGKTGRRQPPDEGGADAGGLPGLRRRPHSRGRTGK